MNNHDLKKGLNRGFDQLIGHIDRKPMDADALPALSEQEKKELFEVGKPHKTLAYHVYRAAAVLAIFLFLTGYLTYVYQVREYTSIHIKVNPSLTIRLKGSKIVRIKADNKDAKSIIEGIDHKGSLDQTIDIILKRINDRGYFNRSNGNIKIKIRGKDREQLKKEVAAQVQKTLGEIRVTAQVQINQENLVDIASVKKDKNLSDTAQVQSDGTVTADSSSKNKGKYTHPENEDTAGSKVNEDTSETTAIKDTEKAGEENTASESKRAANEMNDQKDVDNSDQSYKENLDQGNEKKNSKKSDITRKTKQKKKVRKKSKETSPKKKEIKKKKAKKKEARKKESKKNTLKKQRKNSSKKVKKKQKGKKNSTSPGSKKSSNAEKDDGATGQAVKEVGTENNENIDEESSLKEGTDEDQESTEEKDTGQ